MIQTRPPIERLKVLASALRARKVVNSRVMAAKLNVSRKTVIRDLEFLRDRLGYNFEYVSGDNSFRLISAPEPIL